MNSRLRQQKILQILARQPIATVPELVEALEASVATVRRDINRLAATKQLRKIRGGAEALTNHSQPRLAAHSFESDQTLHAAEKRAIARKAVALCKDGETIIVNGGTTTYRMGEFLTERRLQVLTNSFTMADYLLHHSRNQVILPGGEVYREQNIILSPYEHDTTVDHFYASKVFMGAYAIRQQGLIEADPLLIKAEQKLIKRAEELIVLVDGSKFTARGSLILCPLERIDRLITDDSAPARELEMLERAGIQVIVASVDATENPEVALD